MSKFYMHPQSRDVCVEILRIIDENDSKVKMKVRWWNLGYVGNAYIIEDDRLEFSRDEWNKWVDITDRINSIRTKPGLPE